MDSSRTVWTVLERKVQKTWMVGIEGNAQELGVRSLGRKERGVKSPFAGRKHESAPPASIGRRPRGRRASAEDSKPQSVAEVPRKCHGGQSEGILRVRGQFEGQRVSWSEANLRVSA